MMFELTWKVVARALRILENTTNWDRSTKLGASLCEYPQIEGLKTCVVSTMSKQFCDLKKVLDKAIHLPMQLELYMGKI